MGEITIWEKTKEFIGGIAMNIIIKNSGGYINAWGINKDYESWKVLSKPITVETAIRSDNTAIKTDNRSAIKSDSKTAIKGDSYKRQKTIKDNIYTNSQISPDDKKHELQKIVENNFPQECAEKAREQK